MELPRHDPYLPFGTPGPHSYECLVKCLDCQSEFDAVATDELGATSVHPEVCPFCRSGNLELIE